MVRAYAVAVPYSLRGTKVVKSDTGEVVKDHPTREKALAHLRALKANVEEGAPVLGALLEGFHADERRGVHGRWIATFSHPVHGRVTSPVEAGSSEEAWKKAAGLKMGTVQSVEKMTRLHPAYRGEMVQQDYARDREKIARDKAARAGRAFDPVTMLGREGTAARERGASSLTSEHADTRDKLTSLPVGQRYGLHGPQGQVGRVERTSKGWEVYGPRDATPKVHKTPSSAAGHAMKIQRSAAQSPQAADRAKRGYAGEQEVRGMNARQSQRAEAEAERQLAIRARTSSSSKRGARTARPAKRGGALDEVVNFGGIPTKKGDVIAQLQREGHPQAYIDRYLQGLDRGRKVREAAPEVLGALLEGR